ncbi:MAG: hypothetical protein ACQEQ4_08620 [Fibrobacterota bacterium]
MELSTQVWNTVLNTALSLPGARVGREKYLRTLLRPYAAPQKIEQAISTTPARAHIPQYRIHHIARAVISSHKRRVTALSAASGLPGKWWYAATLPADLVQFFYHAIVTV